MFLQLRSRGGNSRMGERVTQPGGGEFARAARMKKASESGASPSQIPAISPQPSNGKYSHNSCQVSPSDHIQAQEFSAVRLHFLEQMFLAYPDGLSISDNEHRVLWANERF